MSKAPDNPQPQAEKIGSKARVLYDTLVFFVSTHRLKKAAANDETQTCGSLQATAALHSIKFEGNGKRL